MNFKELQDEVLNHGFDQYVYRNRVKVWLNECQERLARFLEIPDLYKLQIIITNAGQDEYTPDPQVIRVNGLVNVTNGGILQYVEDFADLIAANFDPQTLGTPCYYATGNKTIKLSPIPDSIYNLEMDYYQKPAKMVNDDDIPDITESYGDLLVSYALSRAYRSEDDPQMSQFFYAEYMRDAQILGSDKQAVVRDGPRQVRGMW